MKIKTTALDRLFSQYVRSRAGWRCEYSGDTNVQVRRGARHGAGACGAAKGIGGGAP